MQCIIIWKGWSGVILHFEMQEIKMYFSGSHHWTLSQSDGDTVSP